MAPGASPSHRDHTTVKWIPDEEVQECPICQRKFGSTTRKHHCRACGRVVCAVCSDNQLQLPGYTSKQRVCDPCNDLRLHDRSASLAENQSNTKQVEVSLKTSLKEKSEQAEWFRTFLIEVSAEAAPRGPEESPGSASDEASGADSPPGGAELQALIGSARRRWGGMVAELKHRSGEAQQLRQESEALERQCQERATAVRELQKAISKMEADVEKSPYVQVDRDVLARKNRGLREELEGLKKRMANLEEQRTSRGSFESLRSASSILSGGDGEARDFLRLNQCRRSCSVM